MSQKPIKNDLYIIKTSFQNPEENDSRVDVEVERTLVTIEGDIETSVKLWVEEFSAFLIGVYKTDIPGKPEFHLTPTQWYEYDYD